MQQSEDCASIIASLLLLAITMLLMPAHSPAEEIRVAAASNFKAAITPISKRFEARTNHEVTLILGSTGKHYAQIKNGAPYDAFFAADKRRPKLLEEERVAVPGSRFTYAIGKLILWSTKPDFVDRDGNVLEQGAFRYLAIANPKLAPYGQAAQEVLQSRELWDRLRKRLVLGENIGQTFQFVASENADLGFVAYSQVMGPNRIVEGSFWEVPDMLHSPIEQQAVLLSESEVARAFLSYVRSDEALAIINEYGYDTP